MSPHRAAHQLSLARPLGTAVLLRNCAGLTGLELDVVVGTAAGSENTVPLALDVSNSQDLWMKIF